MELEQQINRRKDISPTGGICVSVLGPGRLARKKMMRRFLPFCALLLVLLCLVESLAEGRRGGGGGGRVYIGGGGGARGSGSGSPRSLSGGTWAACVGSSLLVALAML
ncbi:unnamed protein product [Alopecurus aequalis]